MSDLYFDPLAAIDPSDPDLFRSAKRMAKAIVDSPDDDENDYWTFQSRRLLASAIVHVMTDPAYSEENQDLRSLQALMDSSDTREALFRSMAENQACDGRVAACGQYMVDAGNSAPKLYWSVAQQAMHSLKEHIDE